MSPYSKNWSTPEPGCLIVLLDQSGSMDDPFGGENQKGKGKKKSEMVANLLNAMLLDLVKTNMSGDKVKPRADVAVIGYHDTAAQSVLPGNLAGKDLVELGELNENPDRMEMKVEQDIDDTGKLYERPVYLPVWVDAAASGGTPMCAALRKAKDVAEKWVAKWPNNYPPVIVNVTDGMVTDIQDEKNPTEFIEAAKDLVSIKTSDGEALLFCCHITDKNFAPIEYPASEAELPPDDYAKLLFSVSSVLPDSARSNLNDKAKMATPSGARGFIYNGDANSVRQMFVFATISAGIDKNR